MSADIVLRCKGAIGSSDPRLTIDEPPTLTTCEGALKEAPDVWSVEHAYYRGNVDVAPLIAWLHESLGSGMLQAISAYALEHPARLIVSAVDALRPLLFSTPWEVLEESHGDLQLLGNLRVVRSLPFPQRTGGADAIGIALRVLVTWANPSADISNLDEHLQWLRDLPKTSDGAVEVRVVEFTDTRSVQEAAIEFHPNVVYHIGHAEQIGADPVSLRIGADGDRQQLNGAAYAEVLQAISPRIVVLNACSTITGVSLNPYLGMAHACLAACESVVCMQTEIRVVAAKRFGQRLLSELADGTPLSRAVQLGRLSMVAGQKIGPEAVPLFSKFIPVQITREDADPAFDVDANERDRLRIRKRLETELRKVTPLLARTVDEAIAALLVSGKGVAVVTGPAQSGKSTTIRGCIAELLAQAGPSPRILYLSARALPSVEPDHGVRQALNELAERYGWLTYALKDLLQDHHDADASRAITDLATWLSLETRAGRRTVIVLDDLLDDVARDFVSLGATPIDAGLLVVVARAPDVPPEAAVTRVDVEMMSEAEIDTPGVLQRTGGLPYFVAAIARGQPLDGSHLDDRLVLLTEGLLHALRLAALSHLKLPRSWLEAVGGAIDLREMAGLLEESDGSLTVPEIVRDRVLTAFAGNMPALREELLSFLQREASEEPNGPLERERVIASKVEALRQAVELARLTRNEAWLDRAQDFALPLHWHFIREAGDAVAAKAMWEPYREVAQDLGRFAESEVDACYAEALAGVGAVSLADVVLDEVIVREERDDVHTRSLLLRSNILKRLGGKGAFDERVALLRQASALANELVEENPADENLRELMANIEHTLGNTFGYGERANVDEAEQHLRRAEETFDELGDLRAHRARTERIEMLRYNEKLSEEQRVAAIATVERQLGELVTRSMREDAVRHMYELGRLERSPEARAAWFQRAHERAAGSFAPLGEHAELQWKLAELEMGKDTEADVLAIVKKLERWPEDSWSQRLRRNALQELATRAFARADETAGTERLRQALVIARHFRERGEGRGDAHTRELLEKKGEEHGLRG